MNFPFNNKSPKEIVSDELDKAQQDYKNLEDICKKYYISDKASDLLDRIQASIDQLKYILTRI